MFFQGVRDLVTKDVEKAEVFKLFFVLFFTNETSLQQ